MKIKDIKKLRDKYLLNEFILFERSIECSLAKHYPYYNHLYLAGGISALEEALKRTGMWKQFYRKNKEKVDCFEERFGGLKKDFLNEIKIEPREPYDKSIEEYVQDLNLFKELEQLI